MNIHSLKLLYILPRQDVNDFVFMQINNLFTWIYGLKNQRFEFHLRGQKENFYNEQSFIQAIRNIAVKICELKIANKYFLAREHPCSSGEKVLKFGYS